MLDYREYAQDKLHLFKHIKLLVLDNDGIMTDGAIYYRDHETPQHISYSVLDGYGVTSLARLGIEVAVISGRKNPALESRCKVLRLNSDNIFSGVKDKGQVLRDLMAQRGLEPHEVAFMGDDFIDICALKEAGLKITVPNCHPMVRPYVNYITVNAGGNGALREVCDLLSIARGPSEHPYHQELYKFFTSQQ